MTAGIPYFFKTHPRAAALVLAGSKGSRLFPMTSTELPKHLLPIAGIPSILRLLEGLASVSQVVIAVSAEDSNTLPVVVEALSPEPLNGSEVTNGNILATFPVKGKSQTITIVKLSPECFGPVDALREVEDTKIVHPSTRLLVVPGDLVFLQKDISLDALLRPPSESDCTILLVDIGENDEHGVPLKESAKVCAKQSTKSRVEANLLSVADTFLVYCRPKKGLFLEMKRILSMLAFRIH